MLLNDSDLSKQHKVFFQLLVNESNQGIATANLQGNFVFVNPCLCQMLGYSEAELLSMTVFDVTDPQYRYSVFEKTLSTEKHLLSQLPLYKKDHTTFISEILSQNIDIYGVPYFFVTIQDISERIATEQALIKTKKRNDILGQIANEGVWDWHLDTNTLELDERLYAMFGYKNKEFPSTVEEWQKRIHKNDLENITHCYQAYLNGKSKVYDGEYRFLCKDNRYRWVRARGKIIKRNSKGEPTLFVGTHSDISVQKRYEEKILQQAHFDSLTSLPNRFLSLDRLSVACEKAKRSGELVALLFLDLDNFKKVNDTLGHDVGDQLLIEAAARLCKVVRSIDTVGRLGGDEFIIILGGLKNIQEVQPIIENLLNQFRDMFIINSIELLLTASVGISIFPSDGKDTSELLRNADSAMYDAKDNGRNTYSFYTRKMNELAQRRLAIEGQLHGALIKNEFSVHYQAKINLADSKIIGAEALLRWNNPVLGNVPPDEFISVAEQTGIIIGLGEFVLKQSLAQTAIWREKYNNNFEIAVNLSPRQFRDSQLVDTIKGHLKNTNLPANSLELEITEGVLLSSHSHAKEVLQNLSDFGIKIAMDDFGTGYSSLNYLRNYPFDVLKIERSFIKNIATTKKDKALINAIISMSHAVDIKVVAEGIETQQQLEQLIALNCDYGQGYFFNKPLTAKVFTKLLSESDNKPRFNAKPSFDI